MEEIIVWLNQNGTAVQALATVVLVVVTGTYAVFAWRQAEVMEESADAAEEAAKASERMVQLRARQEMEARVQRARELRNTSNLVRGVARTVQMFPDRVREREESDWYIPNVSKEHLQTLRRSGRRLGGEIEELANRGAINADKLRSELRSERLFADFGESSPPDEERQKELSSLGELVADQMTELRDAAGRALEGEEHATSAGDSF